ncbi:Helicase, C-terminal [Ostreococcus tauri]|uniref:Helicase, C-terminal n=1 Tax=Ostreococcus tauri TaxID=70448 RepID=Q016S7_OSTTA|nr:Helicase, C-terminal [Ostreococcus tauri]CAL53584.1 Helicase, C-terminal [Ostreococcus tauri]|eukprot:XP_003079938.1 Helicase, C-terminal [Ostreococcus tauri]
MRRRSTSPASRPPAKRHRTDEDAVLAAGGRRIAPTGIGHGCLHDVVRPKAAATTDETSTSAPRDEGAIETPTKPAKSYPFELDTFQQKAVEVLERKESVLVSAHTSAGKTVVAEYAIAMAIRDGQRVVYTSPLKALSNQKYRELREEFEDVGLMTGDVVINPSASCLVMTTEVLRSMLYKGGEVMREVGWVIYDEIHYMRDSERGVVWEESIVLLPDMVKYVFLSATIPNAREFAEWVCKTHNQPCHIVYTDFRPTPLEHYIFPANGEGIFLVMDRQSNFRDSNFEQAVTVISDSGGTAAARVANRGRGDDGKNEAVNQDIFKIIRMVVERNYDPVIVFAFNKHECEKMANSLHKVDLCDDDEKKLIDTIYWNAMDALSEEDKRLPQVANLPNLLRRGLGVHHSGLLPILKEVIEILFQEGLIKVLFATETMSVGLNMPARTVVFCSPRKFDGAGFRWITSGEYIQMSGRAGRRGKDDRGLVILMMDERMDPPVAKNMLHGQSDTLDSAFRLNYAMILNLMRVEGADPESLIQSSFAQFQNDRALPGIEAKIVEIEKERDAVHIEDENAVDEYVKLQDGLDAMIRERRVVTNTPTYAVPFLQPGRLVRVCTKVPSVFNSTEEEAIKIPAPGTEPGEDDVVWGMIVSFERIGGGGKSGKAAYGVDILVRTRENRNGKTPLTVKDKSERYEIVLPNDSDESTEPRILRFPLEQIDIMSSVRVYLPKDLHPREARDQCMSSVGEVIKRFPDGVPVLDFEKDMKINNDNFAKLLKRIEGIKSMMRKHPIASSERLPEKLYAHREKRQLSIALKQAKRDAKAAAGLIMRDKLKQMRRVLRRLGHTSAEGVVQTKGRVACELASVDELVTAELIFNGTFKEVDVDMLVALVSCLVWRERSRNAAKLSEKTAEVYNRLKEVARKVGKQMVECKMHVDIEEYVDGFRSELMEIMIAWCKGNKFAEIMKMTDLFEGSIVRAIRRVEEVLRQLADACRVIGENELQEKFLLASEKVKRDIVFVASLFL